MTVSITRIDHRTLRPFIGAIFRAAGSSPDEAATVADHLVEANLKGHDSHGVIRAAKYADWVAAGQLVPNRHVEIVSDRPAMLVIDGGFGYGQVIGKEAMALVAERTKRSGLCSIGIRNSGHLGRIGAWPEQLAQAGLASVHFVNTSGYGILVAPHGGSDRRLSANPIAAGVPVAKGSPIILDIATSVIAEGKIQIARNRGDQLKRELVIDGAGRSTTDPAAFYSEPPGAIFPFGGHKGYGLSLFCEIFAGSLTGGGSSHPKNPTAGRLVNNMLSIAFDPSAFPNEAFANDVARLVDWVKSSPPIERGSEVLLPGEIEEDISAERLRTGIPLDAETMRQLTACARRLRVPALAELEASHA